MAIGKLRLFVTLWRLVMIFDLDDLLNEVDKWKFKLYRKLKSMTPKQRADFWRKVGNEAREAGLNVVEPEQLPKIKRKRNQRVTG
jgi:hypothetical protein